MRFFFRNIKANLWGCFILASLLSPPVFAQKTMLVYGPTAGCNVENTPGFNVTIGNAAQWSAATSAQFAAFNVIAFGDCDSGTPCFTNPIWNTAIANEAVWAPVVTGNVFIIGSDPDYHVTNSNVPVNLIYQFATFAGSGTGTGLYIALSCFFQSAPPNTPVPILNGLGAFTVEGQEVGGTCSNAVHKISNNPALNGVTDANLSNWNCSVHEGFDSFPPSFQPLAIATDGSVTNYTAPDGTRGIPFVLARGVTFINTPTPTPSTPYNDFYVSKNLFKPDQGPVSI